MIHMTNTRNYIRTRLVPFLTGFLPLSLGLSLVLPACGPQAYVVANKSEVEAAPGSYLLAGKIDILVGVDNTGSTFEIKDELQTELSSFATELDSRDWNFHLSITRLTQSDEFGQIATSKYDPNWGTSWISPFPGATTDFIDTVAPWAFTKQIALMDWISNDDSGSEPGLDTMYNSITSSAATETGFLRDDAMLAFVAISNGNDSSGDSVSTRSDGVTIVSDDITNDAYKYQQLKSDPAMIRFYSATAIERQKSEATCRGSYADKGTRYMNMAQSLNGSSYDMCNQSFREILGGIADHLHATSLEFVRGYLFMDAEPDTSTITVTGKDGSTGETYTIPKDTVNGWTYVGYVKNVYAIESPVQLNKTSGYALKLNGSYKLTGNQSAEISYKPLGAKDSDSDTASETN